MKSSFNWTSHPPEKSTNVLKKNHVRIPMTFTYLSPFITVNHHHIIFWINHDKSLCGLNDCCEWWTFSRSIPIHQFPLINHHHHHRRRRHRHLSITPPYVWCWQEHTICLMLTGTHHMSDADRNTHTHTFIHIYNHDPLVNIQKTKENHHAING